jgi:hypothetical protein
MVGAYWGIFDGGGDCLGHQEKIRGGLNAEFAEETQRALRFGKGIEVQVLLECLEM